MSEAPKVQRITMGLGPKERDDLEYLEGLWRINRTDTVNRAIRLAARLMRKTQAEGSEEAPEEIEIVDAKGMNVVIWLV